MKKTIFLAAALSFACLAGFSQSAKKDQPAGSAHVATKNPQKYFILLSEEEFAQLYNFISNADIYNEKGRGQCLDFLKQHTYLVPDQKDSATVTAPKPKK